MEVQVEVYEVNSVVYRKSVESVVIIEDTSQSLSLGLQSILHKDLVPSQFIWLHLAPKFDFVGKVGSHFC